MRILTPILFVFFCVLKGAAGAAQPEVSPPYVPVDKVEDYVTARLNEASDDLFATEGTVYAMVKDRIVLSANDASIYILNPPGHTTPDWRSGDRARVVCSVARDTVLTDDYRLICRAYSVVKRGEPLEPVKVDLENIGSGAMDMRVVRTEGVITDVFRDEVDPHFIYLILSSMKSDITLTMRGESEEAYKRAYALLDAAVSVRGLCILGSRGVRRYQGRHIELAGLDRIHVLQAPSPATLRPVPPAREIPRIQLRRFPHRMSLRGTIVAVWNRIDALVKTEDGRYLRFHLTRGATNMPAPGTRVEVHGFLRFNSFFAGLFNSEVRVLGPSTEPPEMPMVLSPRQILYDRAGRVRIDPLYDGHIVTLEGTIKDMVNTLPGGASCIIEQDDERITVRLGDLPVPVVGSKVRLTGACRILFEEYGKYLTRLKGFELVPRYPSDIVVVANPPLLNARRLKFILAVLLAVAIAIVVWNISLRHLAERRGQALMREQFARTASEVKADERTRLAVELHDSVAQNITAVALLLETVGRLVDANPAAAKNQLAAATQMLRGCQHEIRACIWDLRNLALEEDNLSVAVNRAVEPNLEGAHLSVSLDVPRAMLTDNLTHALLRIIRELTLNAVRHGKAKNISIKGALKKRHLTFTIADDGVGFVPAKAPGIAQGHFGLQGVRERLRHFNGHLTVKSSPGKGTQMTVDLDLPESNSNEGLV